jgi:hypothetical protein
MPIRNYTSSVAAHLSCARIEQKLVEAGAQHITKQYADKKLIGFMFDLPHEGKQFPVMLPVRSEKVYEILYDELPHSTSSQIEKLHAQAERTAWKLMYDWVDLQLTLIQLNQVQALEVFMPFIVYNMHTKQTLFEHAIESNFKMLPEPPK